ncbi:MAG: hypothetical protein WCP28_14945 [Actinomycetes bacterium]
MKAACRTVVQAGSVQPQRDELARVGLITGGLQEGVHPELAALASRVIDLQAARHIADYDNAYDPYRPVTVGHVATARAALKSAGHLWLPDAQQQARINAHEQYQRFLLLAYLPPRDTKPR